MRATALFALAAGALVAGAGWILTLVFTSPVEGRSVWIGAAVAFVVQLGAFALLRFVPARHFMAAWGTGTLARVLVLAACALVVARAFGLDRAALLLSLATFFFITMLIEPLMLRA
ncbi:MAG: hypothetical protein ACREON_10815 [Gemmatimonadaceae bacterium]